METTAFTHPGAKVRLDDIPTRAPRGMTKEKAQARFDALGKELFDQQDSLWGARLSSVMVVLQGRDTAGKDGAIKHVVGCLNPRGVNVVSFGVPTEEERQHDFLWRVHRHTPRLGEFAIFNRSHYEDVLVTRVNGLIPKQLCKERYGHIADFEELLAEHGCLVLKYFLHISKREQKERLLEREKDPHTAWKLNPRDWEDRELWDEYTEAYEDAISKTAAPHAPWTVVPADSKWYRNLVIAESIAVALRSHAPDWEKKLQAMGRQGLAGIRAYRTKKRRSRK